MEAESVVPLDESHPWPKDVWPVPPEPTANAEVRVSTPADEKDDVALPPKYAGPYEESMVVEACWRLVSVPDTVRFPPIVPAPLVWSVPAVVFKTPTPRPPVRYSLPTRPRVVEGEVVPMPTFPLPCCTTNCEEPTVKPWPEAIVVVPDVLVNCPRPKYPVPLAVMLVVEAPPDIVNRPDVIVEEALERNPPINLVSALMVAVSEKRFVELAVVAVIDDAVALPSVASPEAVRVVAATEPA